jgi:hypothetical protein
VEALAATDTTFSSAMVTRETAARGGYVGVS